MSSASTLEHHQKLLEGCRLIKLTAKRLNFPILTLATALAHYQFFFLSRPQHPDKLNVAVMTLFFAGKVEDTPKKAKEICCMAHIVLSNDLRLNEPVVDEKNIDALINIQPVRTMRDKIIQLERELLDIIKYHFDIHHAFPILIMYAKQLGWSKAKAKDAWNVLLDSYFTSLFWRIDCSTMAVGALAVVHQTTDIWWQDIAPHVMPAQVRVFYDEMMQFYISTMDLNEKGLPKPPPSVLSHHQTPHTSPNPDLSKKRSRDYQDDQHRETTKVTKLIS